ncbi:MAG: elongation factor G [Akkermansiaceae bacterium]|nr:elongation factor G [Akkermansiaceae bacterium]NNM30107.1 elongation factor G [Akkermansiaceae bacterium]
MKDHQLHEIRNFAVLGHASAGKTTLCEAILATTGRIKRMGTISEGTTTSDYHADEREHQNSIHTSLLRAEWLGAELNMIDAPGMPDFIGDAMGALQVSDFALIVIDAVEGVGFGTERMWDAATKLGIPKFLVINGVDRENSSVATVLEQVRSTFGANVFPLTLPLDEGPGCTHFLDAMRSEVVNYKGDQSGKFEEAKADGGDGERVKKMHQQLVEYVAEADDGLMEKFFDQGGLSEEELRAHLHTAVQAQTFVPLFCTAAASNTGVTRLLDFIAKFGSSPLDRKTVLCESPAGEPVEVDVEGKETLIFVFKTLIEGHVGALSFFRVYSGELKSGQTLEHPVRSGSERIGQILLPNGKDRETSDHLRSGEIGALVKLKDTHTNDTLCSPKLKVRLPKIEYPAPNIHAALKSETRGDEEKIAEGLAVVHEEDPAFSYRHDPELHQTILSGQGEQHLRTVAETLKRRYNVGIELIPPRIPYRETIRRNADSRYRHKKQSGGAGQFAEVWMKIEPKPRDSGVEFGHSLVGNNVDRGFVPSVEKGVRTAEEEGILAGYQVCDLKVDFYDGKQHPVDSKDVAFQIAGRNAFREAFMNADPHLIEPIVEVKVRVPDDALGNVLGDLSTRGGRVLGTDTEGHHQIVTAEVPQRNMHAYATDLRSLTGGRGQHSETFSHYEDMPRDVEKKIIAETKSNGGGG